MKYTGSSNPLQYKGKDYAPGDEVPITEAEALALVKHSKRHSFEVRGKDLLDAVTSPDEPVSITQAPTPVAPTRPK